MTDRTRGWFPLSKFDRRRLIEEGGSSAPSLLSVWTALLEKANDEGSLSLRMRKALIAHMSGLSYRWVGVCLQRMESLGMLSILHQGKHSQPDEPSVITLFPTVNPSESGSGGRNCIHGGAGTAFTGGQERLSRTDCPPNITTEEFKEREGVHINPDLEEVIKYGTACGYPQQLCADFFDHYDLVGWVYGKDRTDISANGKWKSALRRFSRHVPLTSNKVENQTATAREPWKIKADLKILEEEQAAMWTRYGFEHDDARVKNPRAFSEYKALRTRVEALRDELIAPPVGTSARGVPRQGHYCEVSDEKRLTK